MHACREKQSHEALQGEVCDTALTIVRSLKLGTAGGGALYADLDAMAARVMDDEELDVPFPDAIGANVDVLRPFASKQAPALNDVK